MSSGFPGFLGAPSRSANFFVFKGPGTYQFTMPSANNYLADIFGAGGSGASAATTAASGGGGARNRLALPAFLIKPGMTANIIVGAGGASVTGGSGNGNTGGTSSFAVPAIRFLAEAYGGGGGGSVGGGGGGILSAGTNLGLGGMPNIRTNNSVITNLNYTPGSDYGGGTCDTANNGSSAIWGGASGSSTNVGPAPGASLYAGGGGGSGWGANRGGKSGAYSGQVTTALAVDGLLHALMGGAGSGGSSANTTGGNAFDGGFPSGGGGGTDSGTSGKGGDGLVVIYWW